MLESKEHEEITGYSNNFNWFLLNFCLYASYRVDKRLVDPDDHLNFILFEISKLAYTHLNEEILDKIHYRLTSNYFDKTLTIEDKLKVIIIICDSDSFKQKIFKFENEYFPESINLIEFELKNLFSIRKPDNLYMMIHEVYSLTLLSAEVIDATYEADIKTDVVSTYYLPKIVAKKISLYLKPYKYIKHSDIDDAIKDFYRMILVYKNDRYTTKHVNEVLAGRKNAKKLDESLFKRTKYWLSLLNSEIVFGFNNKCDLINYLVEYDYGFCKSNELPGYEVDSFDLLCKKYTGEKRNKINLSRCSAGRIISKRVNDFILTNKFEDEEIKKHLQKIFKINDETLQIFKKFNNVYSM